MSFDTSFDNYWQQMTSATELIRSLGSMGFASRMEVINITGFLNHWGIEKWEALKDGLHDEP